jgi:prepilin-type N-terminal cleavage/methylation domain-containing protein
MTLKLSIPFHRANAFTLVELLLGLAIMAIIGVSVSNVFWSGLKLDDRLRRSHDNYMEVLMADQSLTRDLENAISFSSASYPNLTAFDGKNNELSFLTQTSSGIKRVRYYSGLVDFGKITKTIIGQKVSRLSKITISREDLPIEFLLRQEWKLADWANASKGEPITQIVAAGLKKQTFLCSYAAPVADINMKSTKDIVFEKQWEKKDMPFAVSCAFSLYDAKQPQSDITFKRDIFLPQSRHE